MPSDCNDVSCYQQVSEKNEELISEVWIFSLFCELIIKKLKNCSAQIKKMKDEILSFQLKKK